MAAGSSGALTRRYAPLALFAAAQLIVVLVAPSVPPREVSAVGAPGSGGPATGPEPDTSASASPTGRAGHKGPDAGGGTSGKGDTRHCVHGKQFGDLVTAPPCRPRWQGGDNGGATYQGVTSDRIKIVMYRDKDNPAVKAILQQMGLYATPDEQRAFLARAEKFINDKYELYGRKVQLKLYEGSCSQAPPDENCFRQDAKTLVAAEHPFAVVHPNNANSPWLFDQLSKLRTVNLGGWHFVDSFSTAHRPYHYDVAMGGSYQARLTGEYWCKRLANRKARYAGDATLRASTRKAGILVQEDPLNLGAARQLKSIIDRCDRNGAIVDSYAADTTTASSQATTRIAKFKQAGITSVVYFTDPIAPFYGTKQETAQRYFPENVLVGSGLVDYDAFGQVYDQEQWKHAFGPSDVANALPLSRTDATVVWRGGGGSGTPDSTENLPWSYLSVLASGLQEAGPRLTPLTFESSVLGLPRVGGDHFHPLIRFGQGKYTGQSDAREVYWDPNATSLINGKKGAYVPLNSGRRYTFGGWPSGDPGFPIGG